MKNFKKLALAGILTNSLVNSACVSIPSKSSLELTEGNFISCLEDAAVSGASIISRQGGLLEEELGLTMNIPYQTSRYDIPVYERGQVKVPSFQKYRTNISEEQDLAFQKCFNDYGNLANDFEIISLSHPEDLAEVHDLAKKLSEKVNAKSEPLSEFDLDFIPKNSKTSVKFKKLPSSNNHYLAGIYSEESLRNGLSFHYIVEYP